MELKTDPFNIRVQAGYHMLSLIVAYNNFNRFIAGKVLVDYLVANKDTDLETEKETSIFNDLDGEATLNLFIYMAKRFALNSNHEDRCDFLLRIYKDVISRDDVTPDSRLLFDSLAEFWEIDLEPMISGNFIKDVL